MIPMYEQHESNALSKSNGNNSTSNSVHEINYVYFVFCYCQKIQTCSGHENHFQL